MKYSDNIVYQVNYINSLLKDYEENPIFDNKNFVVNEISWSEYLKVTFNRADFIIFDLIFSSNEFQINIDRANEVLDLKSSDFNKRESIIKNFIDLLFTCKTTVQYCGSNYTKIFFYNNNGDCVKTLKYITGLFYFKIDCKTKEYPPIYSRSRR